MGKCRILDLNKKYTISLSWIGAGNANIEIYTRKPIYIKDIQKAMSEIAKHSLVAKKDFKAIAISIYDLEDYTGYEYEFANKALVHKHFFKDSLTVTHCKILDTDANEFDKEIIDRLLKDIQNNMYVIPKKDITMIFPTDDGQRTVVTENNDLQYFIPNVPIDSFTKKTIKKFETHVAHNFHMAVRECIKSGQLDADDSRFSIDDVLTLKVDFEYLNGTHYTFEKDFKIYKLIVRLNKEVKKYEDDCLEQLLQLDSYSTDNLYEDSQSGIWVVS